MNGGFELYNTPPNWTTTGGGFFDHSFFPAHRIVLNWEEINSPDYFTANVTYTGTFRGVPVNDFGISYAKDGHAYSGISVYEGSTTSDYKEYIMQHLTTPLKADSVYCLSFFVTMADRLQIAVKNIGGYFSANIPPVSNYINTMPQIINATGFITDTVNWVEIQGCFTALGGEQYITIGSFGDRASTDTLNTISTNPLTGAGNNFSYYYIDSVSLWQNNFPTGINDIKKENSFSVYPNPAKDILNIKCETSIEKRKIEIYDALGELVLSEDLKTQNSSFNIHQLASGIYFYSIKQNNSILKQAKFVIMK